MRKLITSCHINASEICHQHIHKTWGRPTQDAAEQDESLELWLGSVTPCVGCELRAEGSVMDVFVAGVMMAGGSGRRRLQSLP